MRAFRSIVVISSLFISFSWLISANATPFQIDEFSVTRNGKLLFQDTFDNGVANDTGWVFGNGSTAIYQSTPAVLTGTESGGRLGLDPFAGVATISSLTGKPIYMQNAFVVTNTSNNPANLHRGLKVDDTINVNGVFDLIAPTNVGERFGVRLTDRGTLNGTGDDVVEVDLRKRSSGLFVEFRERDNASSSNLILDSIELTAAVLGISDADFDLYDQIALILDRPDTAGDILGGFQLIDSGGMIASYDYNFYGSSTIFEGELFTRAQFISVAKAVPEASSIMLLGVGMVMLWVNGSRRRKMLRKI